MNILKVFECYTCNGNRCDKMALRTTCIKNVKFKIVKNKDRLSVCKILLPQRKPKLGRTKPLIGPRVGHSCFRGFDGLSSVSCKFTQNYGQTSGN